MLRTGMPITKLKRDYIDRFMEPDFMDRAEQLSAADLAALYGLLGRMEYQNEFPFDKETLAQYKRGDAASPHGRLASLCKLFEDRIIGSSSGIYVLMDEMTGMPYMCGENCMDSCVVIYTDKELAEKSEVCRIKGAVPVEISRLPEDATDFSFYQKAGLFYGAKHILVNLETSCGAEIPTSRILEVYEICPEDEPFCSPEFTSALSMYLQEARHRGAEDEEKRAWKGERTWNMLAQALRQTVFFIPLKEADKECPFATIMQEGKEYFPVFTDREQLDRYYKDTVLTGGGYEILDILEPEFDDTEYEGKYFIINPATQKWVVSLDELRELYELGERI